jgi:mannose/cellobiose epimerase-like protein (N-acyl-D-glucosamine 2-epimerase family)
MPSSTKAQAHFMSAVAHGWQPKGRHVDVSVAREFHQADKAQGKWEHPGRMERLKGKAKTSAERRRSK